MKKINIAIDGPSGVGKSTIADIVAEKLGMKHLDTGAMYRCVAYKARFLELNLSDEEAIVHMLQSTDIVLTSDGHVLLDGRDVSAEIRTDENSLAASQVSKLKLVRANLVKRQQEMAKDKGFIMDGRDIGTVVLKDAEVKIFMTASAEARAKRRYEQDKKLGLPTTDVETIAKEIAQRDYQDTHRTASPLVKADDAVEIDTSDMTIEEVVNAILALCEPYLKEEHA